MFCVKVWLGFECEARFVPLAAAEHQKEKDMAQSALCKVLQEKEQIAADLNAMERSLSDLCKRLDKHKDAIGGYKKVSFERTMYLLVYYVEGCLARSAWLVLFLFYFYANLC